MRIDDMKPGPDLDVELVRLFGWDHYVTDRGVRCRRDFNDPSVFDFNASTSWEGMQLVVEEMQRRGYRYLLTNTYKGTPVAQFEKYNETYELLGFGRSEGGSAPHAATLAAIKALQGEDTQ